MSAAAALLSTIFFAQAAEPVDYLKDIKPLLAEKCYACHGALEQKADLRLDTVKAMAAGGTNGPAVLPGRADESLILKHIQAKGGARRMPPPSDGEAFKDDQIVKLRRWIDAGAR